MKITKSGIVGGLSFWCDLFVAKDFLRISNTETGKNILSQIGYTDEQKNYSIN